jgi:hypothetical protein
MYAARKAMMAPSDIPITSPNNPRRILSYDNGDTVSGSTLIDLGPNGHDGTISGASIITGHIGNALGFDGVNDKVVMPGSVISQIKGVSGFVRTDGTSSFYVINSADSAEVSAWIFCTILMLTSGKLTLDFNIAANGNPINLQTVNTFAFNTFHHTHIQKNAAGTAIEMFVNGNAEAFTAVIGVDTGKFFDFHSTTDTLTLGGRDSQNPIFRKGDSDQIIVWNDRITPSEVAVLAAET